MCTLYLQYLYVNFLEQLILPITHIHQLLWWQCNMNIQSIAQKLNSLELLSKIILILQKIAHKISQTKHIVLDQKKKSNMNSLSNVIEGRKYTITPKNGRDQMTHNFVTCNTNIIILHFFFRQLRNIKFVIKKDFLGYKNIYQKYCDFGLPFFQIIQKTVCR